MSDMVNKKESKSISAIDNVFDLKSIIRGYTKHWMWFILSCIICVLLGFLHLRYATPEYNAYAKIMLVGDESSTPASAILNDLKTLSSGEGKDIKDEIEVLKSRNLMSRVVKKLKLNINYKTKGRIHEKQIYPIKEAPVKINFLATDSIIYKSKFGFSINIISSTHFNYRLENGVKDNKYEKIAFGKNVSTSIGDIIVTPNIDDISGVIGQNLLVNVIPVANVSESYKNKIKISQVEKFSKVIDISLDDTDALRAEEVINTLIDEYNKSTIEEKNLITKNTADFIDERINLIATDLAEADNQIEKFKTGNKLTNITSEADLYLNSSAQTDQELAQVRSQLNQINFMKTYVNSNESSSFEFIPANKGMSDGSINNLTTKYNDLLRERNSLLNGSTKEKNPIILNLNQQLISIKKSLSQSLENSSKSTKLQIASLENRSARINSKIFAVPGQVRKSRDFDREQGTKESLYLYLLQKREEATISLTSTSSNARIIDSAFRPSGEPISPNKKVVYMASIIIGLCIPFGIIYLTDMLDNKIHNKEDLDRIIRNITFLGEVPNVKGKDADLIKKNDRSILSESFRIIRTNFDYIKRGRNYKDYDNVIFVTSTINGEGKSFFSMNMALTLANTNKRVLIIGADIRNPQTSILLNKNTKNNRGNVSEIGLTEYLVDSSIIVGETINTYEVHGNNIDVMLSGKIPPNPAELLMSDRMKPLFDKVSEQYDYVIVDTAPSMLVTDTLLFSQYAGHTIYLTRAGYTEKRILNFANELYADNKLNGMMMVVNDVKQSNFGYGARYGYGVSEKKGFLSMFKKKVKA